MKNVAIFSRGVRSALVVACVTGLALALGPGCSSDGNGNAPATDAGPVKDAIDGRDRPAVDPDVGSQCISCSLIAGILVDGTGFGGAGGPPGGGGPGGGDAMAFDPCSEAGAPAGGPGGGTMTFCKADVSNAFTQCLQKSCAVACNFTGAPGGGGAMCGADAGAETSIADGGDPGDASMDAAPSDGGGDCKACVTANCAAQYAACEADK